MIFLGRARNVLTAGFNRRPAVVVVVVVAVVVVVVVVLVVVVVVVVVVLVVVVAAVVVIGGVLVGSLSASPEITNDKITQPLFVTQKTR